MIQWHVDRDTGKRTVLRTGHAAQLLQDLLCIGFARNGGLPGGNCGDGGEKNDNGKRQRHDGGKRKSHVALPPQIWLATLLAWNIAISLYRKYPRKQ
jgi:hypothetical protein